MAGSSVTCSGGQFLQNQVVSGGITTGGTCAAAGGGGTLQTAYTASTSPEITVNSTNGALTVQDNASSLGTAVNLFEVKNNTPANIFGVSRSGVSIQPDTNTATALAVNKSDGSNSLTVDTSQAYSNLILGGTGYASGSNLTFRNGSASNKYDFELNSAGGTDSLNLYNWTDSAYVLDINNHGATTFKNSANSTAGFQVQDQGGAAIFKVDTTNKQVNLTAAAPPTADQLVVSNSGQGTTTAGANNISVNYEGGAAAVEGSGMRVDFKPGGTSGGTWNGLRVVANATGAASGVNQNGIKLEGPGTPGAGTETGLNITTGWDIGIAIGSGGMELTNMADPATPATGKLRVYSKTVAGRSLLKAKGPSGVDYPLQPAFFQNAITQETPLTGATVNSLGSTWAIDTTASTPAATQQYGLGTNFATAALAADTAGVSENIVQHFRGNVGGSTNGYFYVGRMAFPDANYGSGATGARVWIGLTDQTLVTMTTLDNPVGNYNGFQFSTNRGDTNWQFMTKNNTTQNVINTTMAFTVGKVYDFYVYTIPQGTTVYWRIDNLTDGTTQEGSTGTNLPTSTAGMRAGSTLQTLTTTARNYRVMKQYVESDQ